MGFEPKALDQVAERTGLSIAAVVDLLDKGWTYVEEINCVPRWESPLGRRVKL